MNAAATYIRHSFLIDRSVSLKKKIQCAHLELSTRQELWAAPDRTYFCVFSEVSQRPNAYTYVTHS